MEDNLLACFRSIFDILVDALYCVPTGSGGMAERRWTVEFVPLNTEERTLRCIVSLDCHGWESSKQSIAVRMKTILPCCNVRIGASSEAFDIRDCCVIEFDVSQDDCPRSVIEELACEMKTLAMHWSDNVYFELVYLEETVWSNRNALSLSTSSHIPTEFLLNRVIQERLAMLCAPYRCLHVVSQHSLATRCYIAVCSAPHNPTHALAAPLTQSTGCVPLRVLRFVNGKPVRGSLSQCALTQCVCALPWERVSVRLTVRDDELFLSSSLFSRERESESDVGVSEWAVWLGMHVDCDMDGAFVSQEILTIMLEKLSLLIQKLARSSYFEEIFPTPAMEKSRLREQAAQSIASSLVKIAKHSANQQLLSWCAETFSNNDNDGKGQLVDDGCEELRAALTKRIVDAFDPQKDSKDKRAMGKT